MPQSNHKYFIVLIITIIVLAVLLLRECGKSDYGKTPVVFKGTKEKTEYKPLPPAAPLIAQIETVKVKVFIPKTVKDTNEIHRLLVERDSLARRLTSQNVSLTYSTDTIHQATKDTLHIECDDLTKQINYSLLYAPRHEKVTTITETYVQELTIWDKLYYSAIGGSVIQLVNLIFGK